MKWRLKLSLNYRSKQKKFEVKNFNCRDILLQSIREIPLWRKRTPPLAFHYCSKNDYNSVNSTHSRKNNLAPITHFQIVFNYNNAFSELPHKTQHPLRSCSPTPAKIYGKSGRHCWFIQIKLSVGSWKKQKRWCTKQKNTTLADSWITNRRFIASSKEFSGEKSANLL